MYLILNQLKTRKENPYSYVIFGYLSQTLRCLYWCEKQKDNLKCLPYISSFRLGPTTTYLYQNDFKADMALSEPFDIWKKNDIQYQDCRNVAIYLRPCVLCIGVRNESKILTILARETIIQYHGLLFHWPATIWTRNRVHLRAPVYQTRKIW